MTGKDMIKVLLDLEDLNKRVTIEYPSDKGLIVGNYCRHKDAKEFIIHEYSHGIIIGIEDAN